MRLPAFLESVLPRPRADRRRRPIRDLKKTVRPLRLEQLEDRLAPSRTITAVTLEGASSVTVNPAENITVVMDVTTAGNGANSHWRSSGRFISTTTPTTYNIVDHANHDVAGDYSETFTITAPTAAGTYNAYFAAYQNDGGAGGPGFFVLNSSVTVLSVPTTTAVTSSSNSSTYGDSVTFTATVN